MSKVKLSGERPKREGFIQFKLGPVKRERLEILMRKTDTHTRGQFFENALDLMEWAVEMVENGEHIGSMRDPLPPEFHRLVFSPLRNVEVKKV